MGLIRVGTSALPAGLGIIILCSSSSLFAQNQEEQQTTHTPPKKRAILEEVIVSARRVEESLQDSPISISVFSQNDLEQIGFADVSDVSSYTPNLDIRKSVGNTDDLALSMRGMFVSDPQVGIDPPIGVTIDGVYLARNAGMAFDIANVKRIEVLRGPQGTLFGRNTIGGAINIISERPRDEFGIKLEASKGRRGRERYHTTIDTGSIGNFKGRLSFLKTDFDGLVASMHTGKELGGRESDGARLSLLWDNDETLSVHYSLNLLRAEASPNLAQITDTKPAFSDPDGQFYGGAYYDNLERLASTDRRGQVPLIGGIAQSDIDGHTLTVEWQAPSGLRFKSITGYRTTDITDDFVEFATTKAPEDGSLCASPNPGDYDFVTGTCLNPVPSGQLVSGVLEKKGLRHEQKSEELQLIGSFLDDRLRFTSGLYYFEETGRTHSEVSAVISAAFAAQVGFAEGMGIPEDAIVPQNRGNSLVIEVPRSHVFNNNKSYAVYSNFAFSVLPSLEITAGFRYSVDDKMAALSDVLDGEFQTVEANKQWSNFKPGFTATYSWTDRISTYAKVASGYRVGGFNQRVTTKAAFREPFNEENVISYEIGWKTELFERSLRFNGALFYADYTDRQITSTRSGEAEDAVITDIVNAGEAVHSGLELNILWQATRGLQVKADYGYLDINTKEFLTERVDPTGRPVNPGVKEDLADIVTTPFAPEHSGSLVFEYRFEPRSWGQVSLQAAVTHTDEAQAVGNPQIDDPLNSQTLFNARATLSELHVGKRGSLRVALWGKNLSNKAYQESGLDLGPLGYSIDRYGELRSYGLDLIYEFNR